MLARDDKRDVSDTADTIDEAINTRRSVRAFLPDPVDDETIKDLLRLAARAPSGTNMQPWKAYVTRGKVKEQITDAILNSGIRAEKIETTSTISLDPATEGGPTVKKAHLVTKVKADAPEAKLRELAEKAPRAY